MWLVTKVMGGREARERRIDKKKRETDHNMNHTIQQADCNLFAGVRMLVNTEGTHTHSTSGK